MALKENAIRRLLIYCDFVPRGPKFIFPVFGLFDKVFQVIHDHRGLRKHWSGIDTANGISQVEIGLA
jgi:hypothetical protein